MDPVHDRGSMDPVHESGPWTQSMKVVHGPSPKWGSMDSWSMFCPYPEFIHVAVVYANEMPLFIGNIEFCIQSIINFLCYQLH